MKILQLIFNGLVIGSIIDLTAAALILIYGILRLSNFAHADFMTLGAYLTWVAKIGGLNLWVSMIIGFAGTIVAMVIAEYLQWKPMRDRRATSSTLVVISIGLALFIHNVILMIWGNN